jgi:hypothetical protein
VEEIKSRRQTRSWCRVEIIGAVHDGGAKALGQAIDCYLQLAVPSRGAEKVKLCDIVDVDEVEGDDTDQAERTGMINVMEKEPE